MQRIVVLIVALWLAFGQTFAQEKPQKIFIPDSCLALGDTLQIISTPRWRFSEHETSVRVCVFEVGNRNVVTEIPRRVDQPSFHILGLEVGLIPGNGQTHKYVRVKEGCNKLRNDIKNEIEKMMPGRKAYW